MALGFWEQFTQILQMILVGGGVIFGAYFLWKSKSGATKDETIKAYKDVIDAYTLKMEEFKTSLGEVKQENKELQAQVNQLIGENKALRNVKPSAIFESTVTSILSEMKTLSTHQAELRQDFVDHSSADNGRFKTLGELASSNNQLLLRLCPQT